MCHGMLKLPGSSENHPLQKGRQVIRLKICFTGSGKTNLRQDLKAELL